MRTHYYGVAVNHPVDDTILDYKTFSDRISREKLWARNSPRTRDMIMRNSLREVGKQF